MFNIKSKFTGVVTLIGGVALTVYALAFLGGIANFLSLCFTVVGIGGIGQGLSLLGAKKIAFPFNILTIIGCLYLIYRIVLIFIGSFA